jgi:hypothetical protein
MDRIKEDKMEEMAEKLKMLENVIPIDYMFMPDTMNVGPEYLEICLEILTRTCNMEENFKIFNLYKRSANVCYSWIQNDLYTMLIPGDSPLFFWYYFNLIYPDVKNHTAIIFPISEIKDYTKNKINQEK